MEFEYTEDEIDYEEVLKKNGLLLDSNEDEKV